MRFVNEESSLFYVRIPLTPKTKATKMMKRVGIKPVEVPEIQFAEAISLEIQQAGR